MPQVNYSQSTVPEYIVTYNHNTEISAQFKKKKKHLGVIHRFTRRNPVIIINEIMDNICLESILPFLRLDAARQSRVAFANQIATNASNNPLHRCILRWSMNNLYAPVDQIDCQIVSSAYCAARKEYTLNKHDAVKRP